MHRDGAKARGITALRLKTMNFAYVLIFAAVYVKIER
jgi:hypothetical protein